MRNFRIAAPATGGLFLSAPALPAAAALSCGDAHGQSVVARPAAQAAPQAVPGFWDPRRRPDRPDLSRLTVRMGGIEIFAGGVFQLNPEKETALVAHLRGAELYASAPPKDGVFTAPIDYPPHERCVEVEIDLGAGHASATVIGADLSHEYVSENADYRS